VCLNGYTCMPSASVIRRRRYPSDCTEAEWALVLPLLPVPAWEGGKGGRPGKHCWRTVLDGACHAKCVSRRCTKIDRSENRSEGTPSDAEHIVSSW